MYEVLAYVYEHYERTDLAYNGDKIARKLSAAGFEREEIHTALRWLAGMRAGATGESPMMPDVDAAHRVYSPRELAKLDTASLGYLLMLEHSGVLCPQTREQVLEYIDANSATSEARRVAETERYIAIPGQALAYKIGQLKISELRERAERELGPRFDVRKFHTAILVDGALPLDVLEAKVDRWIVAQKG